jgi:hypothetical protein
MPADGDFHFWDAPDDITCANMDLIFEGDRMYLHGATGFFGAVPLDVTGAAQGAGAGGVVGGVGGC